MKFQPDSYLLYGTNRAPFPAYPIRLRVVMNDEVQPQALQQAAQSAMKRYPYFAVEVTIGSEENYELKPNGRPVVVVPSTRKSLALGSEEVNRHLIFIEYEGHDIFFNIHHSLTGAIGLLEWTKTTLHEYVFFAYGVRLVGDGIRTADSPLLPGETDFPDTTNLPKHELWWQNRNVQSYYRRIDYTIAALNPFNRGERYYAIDIPKEALMTYAKQVGGSPTSALTVLMLRALYKALPHDIERLTAGIVHNFNQEVGFKNAYHDMVRYLYVPFERAQTGLSDSELNKLTRQAIDEQKTEEYGLAELRHIADNYAVTDSLPTMKERRKYNMFHNRYLDCPRSTFSVSYFGRETTLGALEGYVRSVYCFAEGNLILEVVPLADRFCISFELVRPLKRFIRSFLAALTDADLPYEVQGPIFKRLPAVILPEKRENAS